MITMMRDFQLVEDVLNHRREQTASVKGKDTPYRVEFRYSGGTRSWQYFCTLEDARNAEDRRASYGPTGRAHINRPTSQQVQQRGLRGGWYPVAKNNHPNRTEVATP